MPLRLLDATVPPLMDPIVGEKGMLSAVWNRWFGRVPATLAAIPSIINVVSFSDRNAHIVVDFSGTPLLAGVYRATYHARISQAATVSSSLVVAIRWHEGASQSFVGAAMTGNSVSLNQSNTVMIRMDGGPVYCQTIYASSGGTPMRYSLDVALEKIKA